MDQEVEEKQVESKPKLPSIGGIQLNTNQWQTLQDGGFIFLENMKKKEDNGLFSAYVFLNEEKNKGFFSKNNPDEFIKYGKYEMRIRDKILIEQGYITKAKIKWYGIGNLAQPYLWKENKSDMEYKESWGDPRITKEEKPEKEEVKKQIIIPKIKKGEGKCRGIMGFK